MYTMKKLILISLLSLFCAASSFAQTGTISGKIVDEATGEELTGATVTVKGTSLGAATDFMGDYTIKKVPAGTYTLVISYIAYSTKEISEVVVEAGKATVVNVSLAEKVQEAEETVITATYKKESVQSLLIQQKTAISIGDGISAEQIKQSPVSNSGDVLKKVSGASIQGGKFAVIRGLNDRYNTAYLNGAPLPSTEPDRRAFSFDIIPAGMLDNMVISKAATPDMPGDFSGGIIQLSTRDFPIQNYYNFSISGGINTVTHGKHFEEYKGGTLDFLGIDNKRGLPDGLTFNPLGQIEKTNENSKKFENDWGTSEITAAPNTSFSFSMGQVFKSAEKENELASVFGISYSNSFKTNAIRRQQRLVESKDNQLLLDANDTQYVKEVLWGALWNISYKINKNHRISLKNLYNVNAEDQTIKRQAVNYDGGQDVRAQSYLYTQNHILSNQLSGEHYFPQSKIKFRWTGGYNRINRDIPNYRIAQYQKQIGDPDSLYNMQMSFQPSERFGGRLYQELFEELASAGGDVIIPVPNYKSIKTEIKTGGMFQTRSRNFKARFTGYTADPGTIGNRIYQPIDKIFQPENISSSYYLLADATNPNDLYTASSDLTAAFLMLDNRIGNHLRAVWGVRYENFVQRLDSRRQGAGQPVSIGKENADFLPSINLTYELTANANLRASYSRTLSRPEFRELAPFGFFDYNNFSVVTGNDSLVRALIDNIDLRYELYPGEGQLISASLFYKKFENPIEGVIIPNAGAGSFNASFKNVPGATIYGFEIEARKNFGFINRESKFFKNLVLFGNFAYIIGEVDLSNVASSTQASRPMQGQSPYVINAGASFKETYTGINFSASVNRVGRRIVFVGTGDAGLFPHLWENPRTVLDIQISQKITEKLEYKISIADLLAQKLIFYQDRNKNGKMDKFEGNEDIHFTSYTLGRTVGLSLSYKLK